MSIAREVSEKVEAGEYFHDAREWYLQKYIYTFIERSYLIVLVLGMFVLMLNCYFYYEAIQPLYKNVPVQIRIKDPAQEFSRITYLGNEEKTFDINQELIKFFSAKFVESIESYDYNNNFKKLRINLNFIKKLANDDIYNYYVDRISLRSRNSLILKYKRNLTKKISVDFTKIEIAEIKDENKVQEIFIEDKPEINNYIATVNFEVTDITKQETKKTNWQAKINLSFETIKYDFNKKGFNDLNFKVNSYESHKI
jgi:type IV secretory pathway component VirB8